VICVIPAIFPDARRSTLSAVPPDRRILFFGDSFTAGAGDPTGRSWVGHVVEASFAAGLPITPYNVGVRHDTSLDVAARFEAESAARTRTVEASYGVVLCFGANDMTVVDNRLRVAPGQTIGALNGLLDLADAAGRRVFVVGPPPVGDVEQDERIRELSSQLAHVATHRGVPFVETARPLAAHDGWRSDVAANDGTHPRAAGYAALAQLVLDGPWLDWLRGVAQ
jgi:acyl-CoA thioesterase-1